MTQRRLHLILLTLACFLGMRNDLVIAEPSGASHHNVIDHGATGDGKTDDTAAIQKAIDAAAAGGGGTLVFPPGTYVVTSVGLRPGIRYSGYGATIKRPASQGKWVRTFDAGKQGHLYSADEDSPPLLIEGFVFDGNRQEQGEYEGYQLEQAHLIFLIADPQKPGRLRATVRDCHFKDAVADAISVYTNVDLRISDCTATDCFRGGLVVTGGYSRVQVSDFTGSGKTHPSGVDFEVDGPGYGKSYAIDATIDGLLLPDGDFDVGVSESSRVTFTNVIAAAPFYLYGGGSSVVRFDNCILGIGEFSGYSNRIVNPGNVVFSDCRFVIDTAHGIIQERAEQSEPPEGPRSWAAAHVFWWVSDQPQPAQQSVTFQDCEFAVGKGVAEADTVYAVYAEGDHDDDRHCLLSINGGRIGGEFDYGLFLRLGGRAIMRDVHVSAATALRLGSQAGYPFDVEVAGVIFDGAGPWLDLPAAVPQNRLSHHEIMLDEAQSGIGPGKVLAGNRYAGSRVIRGAAPPGPATHGLPGDLFQLSIPRPGATYEWICVSPGAGEGAAWRHLRTIGD